jgi:hypothetical protein
MSQFFDQASLVMVPSGYKTGKVYSQKPLSTDGELTFTRASTATRVNSSGLIETVASNVPRLDYLNSSCPRLLLEPQRTNLALYSEQFDNVAWVKQNAIAVTANTATSPDGYTNADTLEKASGSGGSSYYYIVDDSTSNTTNTFSVFAKYKTGSGIIWLLGKNSGTFAYFNLQTGTALSASAGMTTKIENYGNGWYRCSFTQDYTGASDYTFGLGLCLADGTPNYDATSAATQGAYIYAAQFEAGAYATSYIPTLGSTVTRLVDDCVKSSATSIIGQTEGVVYFEWEYQNVGSSGGSIPISLDSAGGDEIYFWVQTNGTYKFDVGDSGSSQVSITGSMGSFGTKKIALAYKNNDFALYINGVLAGTDTSGTVPTCNRLYVGRYYANTAYNIASGIKQVLLFPTRLSNADLATLTDSLKWQPLENTNLRPRNGLRQRPRLKPLRPIPKGRALRLGMPPKLSRW